METTQGPIASQGPPSAAMWPARVTSTDSGASLPRYRKHSIGSLPTAIGSQDYLEAGLGPRGGASDGDCSSQSGLSSSSEAEELEDAKDCGGADAEFLSTHELPSVAELHFESASSQAPTQDFPRSGASSWRSPGEADEEDDVSSPPGGPPLLDVSDGIRPLGEWQRYPPRAWLEAAGYSVPALAFGEAPPRYLDLLTRQLLARERPGTLTAAALARHDRALGRRSVPGAGAAPSAAPRWQGGTAAGTAVQSGDVAGDTEKYGDWLAGFLLRARATPLRAIAGRLLGGEVGEVVASFLDALSDDTAKGASVAAGDSPDGLRVTTHKVISRQVFRGRGRAGFYVDSDAAVSTPASSPRSRQPRPSPSPVALEQPFAPPLIFAGGRRQV